MITNIGNIDRLARIVVALALLSMPMFMTSNWKWLGLASIVLIITALVRWCPAYGILGIKTRPTENRRQAGFPVRMEHSGSHQESA